MTMTNPSESSIITPNQNAEMGHSPSFSLMTLSFFCVVLFVIKLDPFCFVSPFSASTQHNSRSWLPHYMNDED